MQANETRIVVVGGGLGSEATVRRLAKQKRAGVTIVYVRGMPYVEHLWASPSLICEPSTLARSISPNKASFEIPGVQYVYGLAQAVRDRQVLEVKLLGADVAEPALLRFDYLVAATGFDMALSARPGTTLSERRAWLEKVHNALKAATNTVLIAGGGSIGVETAGYIASWGILKAGTTVTLVSASDSILPGDATQTQEAAAAELRRLGVRVITGARVIADAAALADQVALAPGSRYALSNGETVVADVYVPAYASGPRTRWLESGAFGGALDGKTRRIVVDQTLRSTSHPALFAVGAVSSAHVLGSLPNVEEEAKTVAANILTLCAAASAGAKPAVLQPLAKPMLSSTPYQRVSKTFGMFKTESFGGGGMLWLCGFPCVMACPCVCLLEGINPMVCGWCCARPEGKGTADLLIAIGHGVGVAADTFKGWGEKPHEDGGAPPAAPAASTMGRLH